MPNRIIFNRILPALALLICTATLASFTPHHLDPPALYQTVSFEEQILQYINDYRQQKNLVPLQMNAVISAQAVRHSADMASGKSPFGHDGFDGRVTAISHQLAASRKFAENVAYGHLSAREVVDLWLNSPGHRHNIEGAYTVTGIGIATKNDGTIFFTQIFSAK